METKNSTDRARFSSSGAEIGKAVGGKTARPCDVCGREQARWYCAADEAYLCEHCDGSVHSANSVARRHERVRLGPLNKAENRSNCCYSSAFMATRRRTRSSRPHPNGNRRSAKLKDEFCSPAPVEVPVPENSPSEEFRSAVEEEEDEDLLHQVPIFMPLAEEFCVSDPTPGPAENYCNNNSRNNNDNDNGTEPRIDRATSSCLPDQNARNLDNDIDLNQFLGSEADLCEFAVDMEMDMKSIIGHGSDEALGCLGSLYPTEKYQHHLHYQRHRQTDNDNNNNNNHPDEASDSAAQKPGEWAWGRIKEEGEENTTAELASDAGCKVEPRGASDARVKVEDPDDAWDTIELNIDYNEFEEAGEGEDAEEEELEEYREPEAAPMDINLRGNRGHEDVKINLSLALDSIFGPPAPADFGYEDRKLISLRLNYEDVLTAWSGRGCPPWRLEPASDDCSSDGAGLVPDLNVPNGQAGEQVPATNNAGGHVGREARVLRYREKRRTRLFSKKIRYEVRKLNAEKRPRMKGRFVKRTSSVCCN